MFLFQFLHMVGWLFGGAGMEVGASKRPAWQVEVENEIEKKKKKSLDCVVQRSRQVHK
jgi:hypothetical protein